MVDVIACTFTIYLVSYFALIDIGSTHSYITCDMAVKLGTKVEKTYSTIMVVSPLGQSILVEKIYKRCPLEIQWEVYLVDLMGFPFNEFDLILGMDWLVEHQVILDCALKRATLRIGLEKKCYG